MLNIRFTFKLLSEDSSRISNLFSNSAGAKKGFFNINCLKLNDPCLVLNMKYCFYMRMIYLIIIINVRLE